MEMNNIGYSHHQRERDRNERRYSVPQGPSVPIPAAASEDLHAWSIYRLNKNDKTSVTQCTKFSQKPFQ